MKHLFFAALILLLFASCSGNKAEHVERAFYYWKSDTYTITESENQILEAADVNKLYIKFFEVEKHAVMGNIPISKTGVRLSYNVRDSLHIVPTVYLHNEVFLKIEKDELDALADNVNYLLNKSYKENFNEEEQAAEYQMDCDWTPSTKDNYFYFLKKIKELSGKKISCTLRLYPYKYPDKMGIPPVDSAMLMCYNLINPMKNQDKNSILDLDELSSYLGGKKYPLHLDVALPLYSWAHVYQNNRFAQALYTDLKDLKKVLREDKPLWYEAVKDTMINDFYLRKGDKVKIEEMQPEYITKAIEIIKNKAALDDKVIVSFFHLDAVQLSTYTNEQINSFYTAFTK